MKTSVIICTHNYAHFLPQCLGSVIEQTRSADEVIVVDDGSTDGTADVLAQFPGVNYIRKERAGKASAFNVGLTASHGDVICHLDADDYWLPRKLELSLDALSRSDAGVLAHDAFYVDGNGKYLYGSEKDSGNEANAREYTFRDILLMSFIYRPHTLNGHAFGVANTICIRRRAIADCTPLPISLGLAVDGALLLAGSRTRLVHVPEKLSAYRHHGNNSFIAAPGSMSHQHELYEWASNSLGRLPSKDRKLLIALGLEADVHAAVHNRKQPVLGSYKAATVLSILAGQGIAPHWKHLALPVVSLLGWKKARSVPT
jgi:glycosyltransferase involved in cell wall biosynthesis